MTRMLLLAAGVCILAVPTPATTLAPATTEDLVRSSERVCCVACEDVEARLDPRSGIVFTHVRLRLLEDLKGAGTGEVLLRIVGGTAQGVTTRVPGMPRFKAGEESVLMLGPRNALGYPVVVQARRGVLRMRRDREGKRYVAERVTGFDELKKQRRVKLAEFRSAVRRVSREEDR